ncbi:hypothetical protein [Nostoc sp. 'Peltigera malacea cyanobiont' DB3992]|uniref:hypothetical protein n=1 Tax=Nostoc sp. 'Peltigera malacea cyanobiont' DB3992 TaxID=1206980 RepID=UPI0015D48B11|nr:hypothetical protein [Nostoc sp. 'Peltigera malacea cyanobiont' DB3992]
MGGYAIAQNRQRGYWHLWCGGMAIASPCSNLELPEKFTLQKFLVFLITPLQRL